MMQIKSTQETMASLPQIHSVGSAHFLLSNGPDMISTYLRSGRQWEAGLLDILAAFLPHLRHTCVLDIGANLGSVSVPLGRMLMGKGQLYSIEAQRNVYYQLCANLFLNGLSRHCTAYHTALSDRTGYIDIPYLDSDHERNLGALSIDPEIRREQGWIQDNGHTETVPLRTLDSLELPAAGLLKIDVEGMEYEVIRGGSGYLVRSDFPPILFEVWGEDMAGQLPKREALFAYLQNTLGYTLFLNGDLCIAQHPNHTLLDFSHSSDGSMLYMTPHR